MTAKHELRSWAGSWTTERVCLREWKTPKEFKQGLSSNLIPMLISWLQKNHSVVKEAQSDKKSQGKDV